MKQYWTAIFFDTAGKPYKYHKICKTGKFLDKFKEFAKTKKAVYINLYDSKTGVFERQDRL